MTKIKLNTYNDCLSYLFNLERAGIKYDLKNIKTLLRFTGNPQNHFKSIHIAGTNGKGSVASAINSFLIEKGFKTALYTSPHILDFRERILINGKFIRKSYIVEYVNKVHKLVERIKPSFFEVTTALAFEYFKAGKVDFAVIEAGLGGRLDSTNVVKPVLSVITTLSIDHREFLGNTLEKITYEKGGIIKKNIPVVLGNIPDISKKILRKTAKKQNSEMILSEKRVEVRMLRKSGNGFYFRINDSSRKLFYPLTGDFHIYNIKTSISSIEALSKVCNISFNINDIDRTFRNLKLNSNLKGRFELISVKPKIITDVSHNLQAIQNIKSNLSYFKYRKLIIIFGMMGDKHFEGCLAELGKLDARIILTKPIYKRAADPLKLLAAVKRNKKRFVIKNGVKDAFDYAMSISKANDLILVTGSFFLVGDFVKIFKRKV